MNKVLVDREEIEAVRNTLANGGAAVGVLRWAESVLAQPAEAEGVELTGEYHADCNRLIAALSAVTAERDLAVQGGLEIIAERDRLREEMCILWNRIDKFESQSHGITALAEIERLRASITEIRHASRNGPISESNAGCIRRIEQIAEAALAAQGGHNE